MTGNDLLGVCEKAISLEKDKLQALTSDFEIALDSGRCVGFVEGIFGIGLITIDGRKLFCVDGSNITIRQVTNIAVKHLHKNPETLHFPAATLLIEIFSRAFPCNQ